MKNSNKKIPQHFTSIALYAKACGTTPQAIYMRAIRGTITFSTYMYRGIVQAFVDTIKYPPTQLKRGRREFTHDNIEI